jgi:hypothetical protein
MRDHRMPHRCGSHCWICDPPPGPRFRWSDPAEPPADELLITLGPEGHAAVWCLDAPSPWAGARLRRFCWRVIETPGFPSWSEEG